MPAAAKPPRGVSPTLDLAALGAQPGNDVIAQLEVRDNHAPTPQTGRSSSVILRLPSAEVALGAELEGRIKKTLPAYFRSQRQIIIDAEALIRQRRSLAAEDFVKRSDAIGVDQRILRLRYGQFLGEESEGAPKPPPTSDLPTSDAPTADSHDDEHDHDHGAEAGAHDAHGHDHGGKASNADAPPVFGSATDVLSEYGHTHDHAEAATLLDPQTRATLKAALDQMWSAEGELRQGRPEQALPFAYKALGFIKQVQQAERIYLARVGPELPPIDEGRRLGGDRAGLASRELPLAARTPPDPAIVEAWQRLGDDTSVPDLDALASWQQRNAAYLPDALDLAAAIEQLRIEPGCRDCRQRLRAQLGGRCSVHCRRRCGAVPPMRWGSGTLMRWRHSHERLRCEPVDCAGTRPDRGHRQRAPAAWQCRASWPPVDRDCAAADRCHAAVLLPGPAHRPATRGRPGRAGNRCRQGRRAAGQRRPTAAVAGGCRCAWGQRVPDLATALRQHPASTLTLVGAGLVARDRDAVLPRDVRWQPVAPTRGWIALPPVTRARRTLRRACTGARRRQGQGGTA